jgi:hypothetical protein
LGVFNPNGFQGRVALVGRFAEGHDNGLATARQARQTAIPSLPQSDPREPLERAQDLQGSGAQDNGSLR